jgi:hypothetical protein
MRRAAWLALVSCVAVAWLGCQSKTQSQPQDAAVASPPDTLPPLEHPPIDPPIRITATFGEYRHAHFHGGTDLSTDHHIGRPVYAPVTGEVERVQASGGGFGNNLLIRARDGRSVLLAHLDAFDEPIASYVAAVQESSGVYEQVLKPAPGRLPVTAGQRVAWSGESGAGPPHLHMEIRWGDVSYNPLRFGFAVPDSHPPVLQRVTLEPLDDTTLVSGGPAPRTFALGPAVDTVVVSGRIRVWLEAKDGVSDASPRDAPYSTSFEWNGESVECRFDRVAWDENMQSVEWVYDGAARVAPGTPIGLWLGSEYQPPVLHASSHAQGAGVVQVRAEDPPRPLALRAADAAGNRSERIVILRPPRAGETPTRPPARRRRLAPAERFELMPVDGPFVRIRFSGAPPGARDVMLGLEGKTPELRPAGLEGARWTAVVRVPLGASVFVARGTSAAGPWERRETAHLLPVSPSRAAVLGAWGTQDFRFTIPERGVFASTFLVVDSLPTPASTGALAPRSAAFEVRPTTLPLLLPARVELASAAGSGDVYRLRGGWAALSSPADEEEVMGGEASARVRGLGRFALFEDLAAPRIGPVRSQTLQTPAPNRWSLRCAIVERGSGLDLSRTRFEIDGRRVPSEWDGEHATLRWRPLHRPAAGAHAYVVVAVDRARHETRATGKFLAH